MSVSPNATTPTRLKQISAEAFAEKLAGDPQEAAQWIKLAAEEGLPEAQALLGQILLDGRGLPKDEAAARAWFSKAAESGHLIAINMLGRCYENGWGGEVDTVAATRYYKDAASHGLDCAMYNYANMLLHGNGTKKNEQLALDWYRQAAARGYAKALGVIGRFYDEGWLEEKNRDLAVDYYRQSAEGGDFRGQYNYALVKLEDGHLQESVEWMQKALQGAHLKFSRTMAENLAKLPHPEFHAIAMQALVKCCNEGDASDYFAYAQALLQDKASPSSQILGKSWLKRAADAGHAQARQLMQAELNIALS